MADEANGELLAALEREGLALEATVISANPILVLDLEGRIVFANPACERVLGRSASELRGEHFHELYHPRDRGKAGELWRRCRALGFSQGELRLRRADGLVAEHLVSLTLLRSKKTGELGVLVLNRELGSLLELRRKLACQSAELAARDELARILSRSLDLETGLGEALDYLLGWLDFRSGGILLYDDVRRVFTLAVQRRLPPSLRQRLKREPLVPDRPPLRRLLADPHPRPLLSADCNSERHNWLEMGLRELVLVPLSARGRTVGLLLLANDRERPQPDRRRLRLLQGLGDQLGMAIANLQLFLQERRRLEQLLLVGDLARRAARSLRLESLLEEVVRETQRVYPHVAILIYLLDAEKQKLERRAAAGEPEPAPPRIALDGQLIPAWVLCHSQSLLLNDREAGAGPELRPLFPRSQAICCVPLLLEARAIGVLVAESEQRGAFDGADLAALQALADQLAIAINNAQLYAGLERKVAKQTAALRTSRAQLLAFHSVAAKIYGLLDRERIFQTAVRELGRFNLRVNVWLLSDDREKLIRRYSSFPAELLEAMRQADGGADPIGFQVPLERVPHLRPVFTRRETVVLDDLKKTFTYKRYGHVSRAWELLERFASGVIYAPIVVQDEVIGLLAAALSQLGPNDIRTVETFALQLSLALENATLFEQLKHAQERMLLMERQAILGRLAGAIAHELRNPLGVIRNATFYLRQQRNLSRDKLQEHLQLIDQEVQRANRIVTELLQIAYRPQPRLQWVPVRELISDCLAELSLPPGIELKLELTDLQIEADRQQLKQICYNIIENAVQAMAGEGQLMIRVYRRDNLAVLEFSDSGPGLNPDALARATEPLFTTKAQGLGLGLTLAEQMVQAHGGRLELRNRPGGGCTVCVCLPLSRGAGKGEGADKCPVLKLGSETGSEEVRDG